MLFIYYNTLTSTQQKTHNHNMITTSDKLIAYTLDKYLELIMVFYIVIKL